MAIKQINGKKTKLYHIYDFPGGLDGKESVMQKTWFQSLAYLGEGNGCPFQYSYLENSMDRGAWGAFQFMGPQRVRCK